MAKVLHKMYLHGDKDYNYSIGEEDFKFEGEVLRRFAYTNYEVELLMETDTETGDSVIIEVDGLTVRYPSSDAISFEDWEAGCEGFDDDYLKRLGVK